MEKAHLFLAIEEGCSAGGVRLLAVSNDAEEGCNAGVGSTAFCQMPMVR